jgi:hypothetical protein
MSWLAPAPTWIKDSRLINFMLYGEAQSQNGGSSMKPGTFERLFSFAFHHFSVRGFRIHWTVRVVTQSTNQRGSTGATPLVTRTAKLFVSL